VWKGLNRVSNSILTLGIKCCGGSGLEALHLFFEQLKNAMRYIE